MKDLCLTLSDEADDTLLRLMSFFQVRDRAAVVTRLLALGDVVREHADASGQLTLVNKSQNKEVDILLFAEFEA